MRLRTNKKVSCIFAVLAALTAVMIWNFSMQNSTDSKSVGEAVMDFLENVFFDLTGGNLVLSMHLLRKIAHFTEFALLGVFIFFSLLFYNIVSPIKRMYAVFSPYALGVAVTDEIIQFFSPGRAPRITDVLIDFSGAAFGFSICILLYLLYIKRCEKKNPAQ